MPKELKSYRSRLLEKLTIPSEAEHYVNAALEDSTEMFLVAMKDVAQAHQMAKVAKRSGVARENLYRAFSVEGNPTLDTLQAVLPTLGLKFVVTSMARGSRRQIIRAPKQIEVTEAAKQPPLFYRKQPFVSPAIHSASEGQVAWHFDEPLIQEKRVYAN